MYFGKNLRNIRKWWRYDQIEFSKIMNVGRASISLYETDSNDPRIKFLLQLEEMTGISIYELYNRTIDLKEIAIRPMSKKEYQKKAFEVNVQMQDLLKRIGELEGKK